MVSQCAWCKKVWFPATQEWRWLGYNFGEVTHTICPDCDKKVRKQNGLAPAHNR